jgi:hypothetical protein
LSSDGEIMADLPERRHLPDYWRHFVDSTVEPNENFQEVLEQFAGRLDGDRFEEAWGGSRDKAYQDEENLINGLAILTDYLRELDGYRIGVDPGAERKWDRLFHALRSEAGDDRRKPFERWSDVLEREDQEYIANTAQSVNPNAATAGGGPSGATKRRVWVRVGTRNGRDVWRSRGEYTYTDRTPCDWRPDEGDNGSHGGDSGRSPKRAETSDFGDKSGDNRSS